jgi:predicted P-loop ATPase
MTYGATHEEWAAWQKLAESDLLPVVMDPSVRISGQSKLQDLGKTPSRVNQAGEAVGLPQWPLHVATDRDIGRWSSDPRLGVCVIARTVKAIDIDIPDPVRAREVEELVRLGLGNLPRRRRANSGKSLLAFRCPVDFPKRIIRTAHGIIELLSSKQQFVACGTHKTGARLEWVDDDTGELAVPAELPEITLAELDALWSALVAQFALPDGASEERNGMLPAVPRNVGDMADPTVAWLDENGWVTGYERDGKVNVRCPWEDGHSTQTGPSSTTYFPAGVGGFAQGHFRCLHASCAGRTDGDFLEATGVGASDFAVVEALPDGQVEKAALPVFARDRTGRIEATVNNVLMALRRPDVCGVHLGFDTFKDVLMIGHGERWRPFAQHDYIELRSVLEMDPTTGFKPINAILMREAVHKVAHENAFDSAVQWAESLEWDGVPRIDTFWPRYFGVEDTEYSRAVSRYTWTALAARALVPGEKCDMVPVLIGLQGAGKTSVIEKLAPLEEMFGSVNLEKKDDDIARQIRGKLVLELAELRGLASRDAEAIKDWVTRRFEEWIPKYQEFATRYGRRFLAIGTGNREGFLDDETGERRWLPMTVGTVDAAAVARDRDQLWSEGVVRYRADGVEWQGAYALGRHEHGKYKVGDVWEEEIARWLAGSDIDGPRDRRVLLMRDVMVGALGIPVGKAQRRDELRAGKALRALGYEKAVRRVGGSNAKVWALPIDIGSSSLDAHIALGAQSADGLEELA